MRQRKMIAIEENPSTVDDSLLWYSRAVGAMRGRPFADPTSWRFQAAVHDWHPQTDPYADPADPPPALSVARKYWFQCQHSSWFFLPWHRMYLHYFEEIVAKAIVDLGGPGDWALPYWDYEHSALARKLPWWLRQPTWPTQPGGEPNHLFVAQREPTLNAGTGALSPNDIESATALAMPDFSTDPASADVQFGGPRARNHDGGTFPFGGVESSPHNNVHVAVGAPDGFMLDPTTAALDPVFWLHHCNIDRLWEVWLRAAPHQNPTQAAWGSQSFPFHDANGAETSLTCAEVVDTRALGYAYLPLPPAPDPGLEAVVPPVPRRSRRRSELAGASRTAVKVRHDPREVRIALEPDVLTGDEGLEAASPVGRGGKRVLLHLENLEAKGKVGSFDVLLVDPRGVAATREERFVGRISLFGNTTDRRKVRAHGTEGFSFVLDITDEYLALGPHAGELRVSIEPVHAWSAEVRFGRVSVNVA